MPLDPAATQAAFYAECASVEITALVPIDGSQGVSPEAVPYMIADTACGTGTVRATLSDADGTTQTMDLEILFGGLYQLDGFILEPNATYTLFAGRISAAFETGEGPVQSLEGHPSVTITGSDLEGQSASVGLHITTAPDPFGAPFTLSREGELILTGVDDQTFVDSFSSKNHVEWCYALNQYLGDGSALSGDETCVELTRAGCSTGGGGVSMTWALGLMAVLGRRRPADSRARRTSRADRRSLCTVPTGGMRRFVEDAEPVAFHL